MLSSFKNAFRGLYLLIKSERNFRIHLAAFLIVLALGFYFNIRPGEWVAVLVISAIVFGLEGLNSALERLCDEVTEERKESIRNIKDIAAGAVLVAALIAVVIGVMVFGKYLV